MCIQNVIDNILIEQLGGDYIQAEFVFLFKEMPYAGKKIDEYGNVKYEGFCIDILDYIAESMKFKYEIQEEPTYGNCDEKECTGMYQKLIDRVRHSDIYAHAKIF